MAVQRYLSKAPITEAVFDVRITPIPGVGITELKKVSDFFLEQYPKVEDIHKVEGFVQFDLKTSESHSSIEKGHYGYKQISNDGKEIIQVKINGLTFSRLYPYAKWDELLDKFKYFFDIYSKCFGNVNIVRAAVRYINHLDIPLPVSNLSEYINVLPLVPGSDEFTLTTFLSKVIVHYPSSNIKANITCAIDKSTSPGHIRLLLDNDVYLEEGCGIGSEGLWGLFGELHRVKNMLFFESITEEAARLYE